MKNLRFGKKLISLCHHKANPLRAPRNHFRDPSTLCDFVICERSLKCFAF